MRQTTRYPKNTTNKPLSSVAKIVRFFCDPHVRRTRNGRITQTSNTSMFTFQYLIIYVCLRHKMTVVLLRSLELGCIVVVSESFICINFTDSATIIVMV